MCFFRQKVEACGMGPVGRQQCVASPHAAPRHHRTRTTPLPPSPRALGEGAAAQFARLVRRVWAAMRVVVGALAGA